MDSHGAFLSFNGVDLGSVIEVTPAFSAANVHDTTDVSGTVLGNGVSARVVKKYNVSSIEPGTLTARFIGSPAFGLDDIGSTGVLQFSWQGGSISANCALVKCEGQFSRGELIHWIAEFQATGY